MKVKLVTIGILALLLCAMVPMAATAKPPFGSGSPVRLGVTYKVCLGWYSSTNGWTWSPNSIGTLFIARFTDNFQLKATGVGPGVHTMGLFMPGRKIVYRGRTITFKASLIEWLGTYQTDANGNLNISSKMSSGDATKIANTIAQGGAIVINSQQQTY